jgi:hypothetical protein
MRLLPPADPRHHLPRVTSARTVAALLNVAMGVRLLWPDEILTNPANPGYQQLARHVFGDVPLALALLTLGVVMTTGLYTDRWQRIVEGATWLSLLTWVVVAVDIALVNVSQLGTLVYAWVAVVNGYAYAHLREWQEQLRRNAGPTP